jgi:hypothetical protein
MLHESEIALPVSFDTFRTQLFGADLTKVMGQDGSKGLPRVIVDAVRYLRAEGIALVK